MLDLDIAGLFVPSLVTIAVVVAVLVLRKLVIEAFGDTRGR